MTEDKAIDMDTNFPLSRLGYEWPLKKDPRNFPLEKAQAPQPFPETYVTDISHIPVFFQAQIPDCVENAVTFIKKYHDWKNTGVVTDLSRRSLVIPTVQRDGFSLDEGTSIENALYVAHKLGICETSFLADDHSLTDAQFANPSVYFPTAQANALTHTILSYAFLTDLSANGLKNAIYQNGVIVVGALINKNWWTAANGNISWDKADIYPIRPPITHDVAVDPTLSGHCFVVYGYDQNGFKFRNSFGSTWADGGNNYFPNSYLPFIYEAATIVDLTEAQIQALKQAQSDANSVQVVISQLNPNSPATVKILPIIGQIIALLSNFVKNLLS